LYKNTIYHDQVLFVQVHLADLSHSLHMEETAEHGININTNSNHKCSTPVAVMLKRQLTVIINGV